MFSKTEEQDIFDGEVLRLISEMSLLKPNSDEYTAAAKNLASLQESRYANKKHDFSKDAILAASANIAGILLVLNFERVGVLTSKAFSLVSKIRI